MHLSKARSRAARILAAATVMAATWAVPGTEPAGAAIDTGATLNANALVVKEAGGYTAIFDGNACFQSSSDDAPIAVLLGQDHH